jgi:hypothetical protein
MSVGILGGAVLLAAGCGGSDSGASSSPTAAAPSEAASSTVTVPKPDADQQKELLAKLRKIKASLVEGREDPMVDDAVNICSYVMNGEPKSAQVHAVVAREDGVSEAQAKKVLAAITSTFCH